MWSLLATNDYQHVANREAVKLYDPAGTLLGTVGDAKRLGDGISERESSDGKYLGTRVSWRLPACLVTASLVPGCCIADVPGVVYTILSLDPPKATYGVWRCTCMALMLLGDTITWHLPANQADSYGSPLIDQSGTMPAQVAAIHEAGEEEVAFQGIVSGFRQWFNIWTLQEIPKALGTIGVDQNGIVYTVKAVRHQRHLDALAHAYCVIEP